MNTLISPGDIIIAKQDFSLYDNKSGFGKFAFVKKNEISLVVAVIREESHPSYMMTLCMLSTRLNKFGWIYVSTRCYIDRHFLILAHS